MSAYFTSEAMTALFQVIMIDLVLAGDNAIVIGLAAAGLPQHQRTKVIFWGITAATLMRIGFASVTIQLLQIIGLLLAGGILLLWVCWKMWRELRAHASHAMATRSHDRRADRSSTAADGARREKLSARRSGRSSSPTCRCRSTTCSRLRARRATIPISWSSAWYCRSR